MLRPVAVVSSFVAVSLAAGPSVAQESEVRLLVFSRTAGFRHASIPAATEAVAQIAAERGWEVEATEDPSVFLGDLSVYSAVVFLMTTGDVLSEAEQAAFEAYIRSGGGFAGIHSASDTEYDWPWYGELVGAWFALHPLVQSATVHVVDPVHPSTRGLPRQWERLDEWYDFRENPRGSVHVLAIVDDTTYGGGLMGWDHPIAWCQRHEGGRSWYTAGGHTEESWEEELFLGHVAGGLAWAAGVEPGDCEATLSSFYRKVVIATDVRQPLAVEVAPDGRAFFIERAGRLSVWHPDTGLVVTVGELDVTNELEDGLLGLALDPGFADNGLVYLFYSPADGEPRQHISRFRIDGDALDLGSEEVLLVVPTQREACCHSAGNLEWAGGHLWASIGDNTNPWESSGYSPIDERPGRGPWDAQKSASNTDDLRGKIVRIDPLPEGGYAIPDGNLFPADGSAGRPEIYVMGVRNPYRFSIDPSTGWLYWGDVGPDAFLDSTRGPRGFDEVDQARGPGNFGWPYCIADNRPYADYDFDTRDFGPPFDCEAPVNESPNNTGDRELPPATGAWIWYPYGESDEFPALDEGDGGRSAIVGPVVRHDPGASSPSGLPAYWDGALLLADWSRNWIKEVRVDANGSPSVIQPFLPDIRFARPIDVTIGPDGSLFVVEYGSGWQDNEDAQIVRIDYLAGAEEPTAIITASRTSGPVPLVVELSAEGSNDPQGDALELAWDLESDGTIDATSLSVTQTYEEPGSYTASLTVTDMMGNEDSAQVTITAGNTAPVLEFLDPPEGGLFGWNEHVRYRVRVADMEDGSTGGSGAECLPCDGVRVLATVVHPDREEALGEQGGCEGSFLIATDSDPVAEDLHVLLEARFVDAGGLGGTARLALHPKRRQAEHYSAADGLLRVDTSDPDGGGLEVSSIGHGDWARLDAVDLEGIDALIFRATVRVDGTRIEVRADDPADGVLVAEATTAETREGEFAEVSAGVADPGGAHDLYLVFLRNPGSDGMLALNWLEFSGSGVSTADAPRVDPAGCADGGGGGPRPDAGADVRMHATGGCSCSLAEPARSTDDLAAVVALLAAVLAASIRRKGRARRLSAALWSRPGGAI